MNIYTSLSAISSLINQKVEAISLQTELGRERAVAKAKEDLRSRTLAQGNAVAEFLDAQLTVELAKGDFATALDRKSKAIKEAEEANAKASEELLKKYEEAQMALVRKLSTQLDNIDAFHGARIEEQRLVVSDAEVVLDSARITAQQAETHLDAFGVK